MCRGGAVGRPASSRRRRRRRSGPPDGCTRTEQHRREKGNRDKPCPHDPPLPEIRSPDVWVIDASRRMLWSVKAAFNDSLRGNSLAAGACSFSRMLDRGYLEKAWRGHSDGCGPQRGFRKTGEIPSRLDGEKGMRVRRCTCHIRPTCRQSADPVCVRRLRESARAQAGMTSGSGAPSPPSATSSVHASPDQ